MGAIHPQALLTAMLSGQPSGHRASLTSGAEVTPDCETVLNLKFQGMVLHYFH